MKLFIILCVTSAILPSILCQIFLFPILLPSLHEEVIMTEYDYSPEAYERYKAKLHSIGRWVHETERFEPANPFIMSPAPTSRSLDHSGPGSETSSSTFRQVPRRSYTAPHSPQQIYSSQPAAAYQYTPVIPPGHYPSPSPSPGPRRSNTYHAAPPVPPLPPQLQSPKRSFTGGYPASPQVIYDPRVGMASRVIVRHCTATLMWCIG